MNLAWRDRVRSLFAIALVAIIRSSMILGAVGPCMAWALDVNLASQQALEQVKGVGPATARRIIAARLSEGPFRDGDDLQARVSGVGPRLAENIRQHAIDGLAVSKRRPGANGKSSPNGANGWPLTAMPIVIETAEGEAANGVRAASRRGRAGRCP